MTRFANSDEFLRRLGVEPKSDWEAQSFDEEAARSKARDKWRALLANHIEEGKSYGRSEIESMDRGVYLSRVMTPEENREYNWAFEGISRGVPWKKWGGGNKGPSGTSATRKAAIARISKAVGDSPGIRTNVTLAPDANVNDYQHSSYDDGLGFKANQFFAGINAKFNDTQGKNMPSNPSFGFSQQTLNDANARGAEKKGWRNMFSSFLK